MVSGEKRANEEENFMEKVTVVLLDIEGTTTSVSFVKDTLFPYVKEHLQSYVDSHWDDFEFKDDVAALKEQAKKDEEDEVEGFSPIEEGEKEKESLIKNVLWQMSLDRKTTALKQLQGHIWREGYKSGKIKGHIYSDVVPMLKKWNEESRKVYIFSSGSVEAQKLFFGHTEEGNLLEYITGYFDTTSGPKNESSSYANIIKSIECEKEQILFLTDVVKEAEAARAAGMKTAVVIRENNAPLTDDEKKEFMTITSFSDLICENAAKRKKLSDGSNDEVLVEKKGEKEPEKDDTCNSPQTNGTEKMDVDATSQIESKPESTEKTGNKTDDETKTESDEIEIDVVSEEEKKEGEEEEEGGKENGEEETSEQMEKGLNEPQVDVADPTPETDPLDVSEEKAKKEEQEEKEEKPAELNNGTADEGKPEEKQTENETNGEAEVAKTVEGTEMNGDAVHDEKKENGVEEETIPVSKIVADDKPEPAVEVKA